MRIAYIADINCIHGHKWISYFSEKHEVILICAPDSMNLNLYKYNKRIKIYSVLPSYFPLSNLWLKYQTLLKIKKILKKHSIQLLHSMYLIPNSFWGHLINFPNHIITTRGSDILIEYSNYKTYRSLKELVIHKHLKKLTEKTVQKASHVTSTSSMQQAVIKKIVKDVQKLHLIRTGVDIAYFQQASPKYNFLDKMTILTPRLIQPLYNTAVIVDAFLLLKNKLPKYNLKLIILSYLNNNDYFNFIKDKIKAYQLERNIVIVGEQDKKGMLELYKKCDLVMMIPDSDGTPVTAIEAMLTKKPLIVGNVSYDKDLFNEKTVWQLKKNTTEDLLLQLLNFINLPQNIIDQKVDNAYNAAVQFADFNKEILKMELLYHSVLKYG